MLSHDLSSELSGGDERPSLTRRFYRERLSLPTTRLPVPAAGFSILVSFGLP
jgi:hypothetical protein